MDTKPDSKDGQRFNVEENARESHESSVVRNGRPVKRLDTAGWGLFFIWVGVALLMDLGWGVGLVGVAVITLGGQVARRYFGLRVETFWVVAGLLLLAGGVWDLAQIEVSLVPVLLIVAGAALLVSIFGRRRKSSRRSWCGCSPGRRSSSRSRCWPSPASSAGSRPGSGSRRDRERGWGLRPGDHNRAT